MSNTLGVGLSGLQAFQVALSITGDNIANSETEGYSRQRVNFQPLPSMFNGVGYVGNGVTVEQIERVSDDYLTSQEQNYISQFAEYSTYTTYAYQVNDLFDNTHPDLNHAINDFFNSIEDASLDPSVTASRTVVMAQGQALQKQFSSFYNNLMTFSTSNNLQISECITRVNLLTAQIADLNNNIVGSASGGGQYPPNNLLDERDEAIRQLAELLQIQTVQQGDGSINVFVGNGQSLVLSGRSYAMGTMPSLTDSTEMSVGLVMGNSIQPVTTAVGGKMGGLLDVKSELIDQTLNDMGRIALCMVDALNEQHRLGMDQYGVVNRSMFVDINSTSFTTQRVGANPNNQGLQVLSCTITDPSQLTDSDYVLKYNGGLYQLYRNSDDTLVSESANLNNISVDGLSFFNVSGTAADGNIFYVHPTRQGTQFLQFALTDPRTLALANPVQIQAASANTGTATLSTTINNTSGLPVTNAFVLGNAFSQSGALAPPLSIQFTSATQFQILNMAAGAPGVQLGAVQTYNPMAGITLFPLPGVADLTPPGPNPTYTYDPGFTLTISGTPATGDIYNLTLGSMNSRDNQNGNLLVSVQEQQLLLNGTATLSGAYASAVSNVGSRTNNAELQKEASEAVLQQVQSLRLDVSGVNLDEEAAALLQYQQAYAACAQVLMVVRSLFDTILEIL